MNAFARALVSSFVAVIVLILAVLGIVEISKLIGLISNYYVGVAIAGAIAFWAGRGYAALLERFQDWINAADF